MTSLWWARKQVLIRFLHSFGVFCAFSRQKITYESNNIFKGGEKRERGESRIKLTFFFIICVAIYELYQLIFFSVIMNELGNQIWKGGSAKSVVYKESAWRLKELPPLNNLVQLLQRFCLVVYVAILLLGFDNEMQQLTMHKLSWRQRAKNLVAAESKYLAALMFKKEHSFLSTFVKPLSNASPSPRILLRTY